MRRAAFDAILAALTSPAALRLQQRGLLSDLQLEALLAAPVPAVLLSSHARRCLSQWDAALVADANAVIDSFAAVQRVICHRPATLDDDA